MVQLSGNGKMYNISADEEHRMPARHHVDSGIRSFPLMPPTHLSLVMGIAANY